MALNPTTPVNITVEGQYQEFRANAWGHIEEGCLQERMLKQAFYCGYFEFSQTQVAISSNKKLTPEQASYALARLHTEAVNWVSKDIARCMAEQNSANKG